MWTVLSDSGHLWQSKLRTTDAVTILFNLGEHLSRHIITEHAYTSNSHILELIINFVLLYLDLLRQVSSFAVKKNTEITSTVFSVKFVLFLNFLKSWKLDLTISIPWTCWVFFQFSTTCVKHGHSTPALVFESPPWGSIGRKSIECLWSALAS